MRPGRSSGCFQGLFAFFPPIFFIPLSSPTFLLTSSRDSSQSRQRLVLSAARKLAGFPQIRRRPTILPGRVVTPSALTPAVHTGELLLFHGRAKEHTHTHTLQATLLNLLCSIQHGSATGRRSRKAAATFFLLPQPGDKNRHQRNEFHPFVFPHPENTVSAFA